MESTAIINGKIKYSLTGMFRFLTRIGNLNRILGFVVLAINSLLMIYFMFGILLYGSVTLVEANTPLLLFEITLNLMGVYYGFKFYLSNIKTQSYEH